MRVCSTLTISAYIFDSQQLIKGTAVVSRFISPFRDDGSCGKLARLRHFSEPVFHVLVVASFHTHPVGRKEDRFLCGIHNRCLHSYVCGILFAASGTVKKVIEINPYLLGTMAGGAADCSFWERNLGIQVSALVLLQGRLT